MDGEIDRPEEQPQKAVRLRRMTELRQQILAHLASNAGPGGSSLRAICDATDRPRRTVSVSVKVLVAAGYVAEGAPQPSRRGRPSRRYLATEQGRAWSEAVPPQEAVRIRYLTKARRQILEHFLDAADGCSVNDIARATGLAKPTVASNVTAFARVGWLAADPKRQRSGSSGRSSSRIFRLTEAGRAAYEELLGSPRPLAAIRRAQGLTQEAVARDMRTGPARVRSIERHPHKARLEEVCDFFEALGATEVELTVRFGDNKPLVFDPRTLWRVAAGEDQDTGSEAAP